MKRLCQMGLFAVLCNFLTSCNGQNTESNKTTDKSHLLVASLKTVNIYTMAFLKQSVPLTQVQVGNLKDKKYY